MVQALQYKWSQYTEDEPELGGGHAPEDEPKLGRRPRSILVQAGVGLSLKAGQLHFTLTIWTEAWGRGLIVDNGKQSEQIQP